MANVELKAYRKLLLNFVYYNFLFRYTLAKTMRLIQASCECPRTAYKCMQLCSSIYNLSRTDVKC